MVTVDINIFLKLAPEIVRFASKDTATGYSKEVDMWSLGVILYLMLSAQLPFNEELVKNMTLYTLIETATYEFDTDNWEHISEEAKDLIKKLLVVDPKKRLKAVEALEHEWIKKGKKGKENNEQNKNQWANQEQVKMVKESMNDENKQVERMYHSEIMEEDTKEFFDAEIVESMEREEGKEEEMEREERNEEEMEREEGKEEMMKRGKPMDCRKKRKNVKIVENKESHIIDSIHNGEDHGYKKRKTGSIEKRMIQMDLNKENGDNVREKEGNVKVRRSTRNRSEVIRI